MPSRCLIAIVIVDRSEKHNKKIALAKNDLSKRARRGAAAMCQAVKLTIETSLPTWIQSWKDPQQIEADQHCHQQ